MGPGGSPWLLTWGMVVGGPVDSGAPSPGKNTFIPKGFLF